MNRPLVAWLAVLASAGLVAFLLIVPGCSATGRSIQAANLGSAHQVLVYQGGKPVLERSIATGSEEDKAVAAWLQSHEDGWRPDLVTYAPARRVRGESFTLDFHNDRCILNYRTNKGGEWSQVSRPLAKGDPIPEVFARSQ